MLWRWAPSRASRARTRRLVGAVPVSEAGAGWAAAVSGAVSASACDVECVVVVEEVGVVRGLGRG